MSDFDAALTSSRRAFSGFVDRCRSGEHDYRLTPAADASAYARCFGVFCRALVSEPVPPGQRDALVRAIRDSVRGERRKPADIHGKGFRQLLAFSLSALAALGALAEDPLEELVAEQINRDVRGILTKYGCLAGAPGSGNQAMFTAVFLLHGRDHLAMDTSDGIEEWVALHLRHMNRFGFWGPDSGMTHLQFQNGYHQYEILEYLGVPNPRRDQAAAAVRSLADADGHFAPYPGGGGCYDYDAVFMLTPDGHVPDDETRQLLRRTAATLLDEQQEDGGFAESLYVRPTGRAPASRTAAHVVRSMGNARLFLERLRLALALERPRHRLIHTHWSAYSRRWDESDLWDSWFRMLTLARIHSARERTAARTWGFISYPGIGFHPSAHPGWHSPK